MFSSEFIKVSKDEWTKIEELVSQKNETISKLQQEVIRLQKYKAQDDLLFSYENENRKYRKEIKKLTTQLSNLNGKVDTITSSQKLFLSELNKSQNRLRDLELLNNNPTNPIDYEVKTSNDILGVTYA